MNNDDAQAIRQALTNTLPSDTSLHGQMPMLQNVYAPPSHLKALRMECSLVIGTRGVGKTFWSAALRSERIREMLRQSIPELSHVKFRTGFGETPDNALYPEADVFGQLLSKGFAAYDVWRAVIGRWLSEKVNGGIPQLSWEETVAWVKEHPEDFARLLENTDKYFKNEGEHGLIVFDALDRSSDEWRTMDKIVRDLLRVVLSLKRYQNLHGKVFLREDQAEGRQITDFPDASKLLATRVELTWAPHDLHGLLWQYFCNGAEGHGTVMRELFRRVTGAPAVEIVPAVWSLPDNAKRDESIQRSLFAAIAGESMGRDRRRGVPYSWTVGHLADGRGRTSPRSFLAAISAAAEDSRERHAEHDCPLHYESIKRGVQEASQIRVAELAEDYPWVKTLMEPLKGLTVPCLFQVVIDQWGNGLEKMQFDRLPPEHQQEGCNGVRQDLEKLGIFERMRDGRVNMPDLYRVGFGLGRRGGVKPIGKASGD